MSRAVSWGVLWGMIAYGAVAAAAEPRQWVAGRSDELVALYRHWHQSPELSHQEEQTAARLAEEWRKLGADVTTGVGGHGVVGVLKNGAGPTLMLRCDMDALPIVEQTRLVYASKVKVKDPGGSEVGVMHACGHDLHMTNLTGAAKYLAEHKAAWQGTLMLVGQPAEERGNGAKGMIDAGLFKRFPKPDFALAMHCDAVTPLGKIGFRGGYTMANVDSVDITIFGRGGHGAYPHTTIDPIVIAARLVLDLQTIVSREVKPTEPAVITVGAIHAGTKHNIISDQCQLQLTVRSYKEEIRKQLLDAIRRKTLAAAASAGAPEPKLTVSEGTPALHNDQQLATRLEPVLRQALGEGRVVTPELSMGGEDFSQYGLAGVPVLMFWVGTVDAARMAEAKRIGQDAASLHSPFYYPDAAETLATSIPATIAAAIHLLPAKK